MIIIELVNPLPHRALVTFSLTTGACLGPREEGDISSENNFHAVPAVLKTPSKLHLTLVRMALLAPLCRMANTFECPCSASPSADPKLVSEDTSKMAKS